MKHLQFVFLLVLLPVFLLGQTNTDFWFAAPEVTAQHGDEPIYLRLTSFGQSAYVTITQPANTVTNFPTIYRTIPANSTIDVNLTALKGQVECKPPNTPLNFGLHIQSTSPITAYYEEAHKNNPEIFTLKGNNALGTSFFIPGQNVMSNYPYNSEPKAYSSFDIVATEDNTTVTINPRKAITGHAAGIPFDVILNKGQVYSARATGFAGSDHLQGSTVISDKPVCITVKDDSDIYPNLNAWDLTGDQIVPVSIIGMEYIVVRGYTNPPMNDRAFITATANGTNVIVDGAPVATLDAGATYMFQLIPTDLSAYIVTDKPAYVWHLTGYDDEAGSALLPPMNCTGSTQVAFTRSTQYSFEMIILTKAGAQGSFTLDGNPDKVTASMFSSVAGNPAFVFARIPFTVATLPVGAHFLSNSLDIFHMGVIHTYDPGQSGCSYGYFSDFASLNLGADQSVCPGATHTFDAGPGRLSYEWLYNGNLYMSGVQTITVSSPGLYSVTVNDHGCMLTDEAELLNFTAPNPVIAGVTSFCQGESQQLSVTGSFNGYLWSTGATTQAITVNASGTYEVTVTDNNGCQGTASVIVTVNPVPHLTNNPASKAICSSTNTNVTLISDVTGTLFTWTSVVVSGSVTGNNNSSQPGLIINDQLTNTGITNGVVKYSITPQANNCIGPVVDYLVTVHPIPHLTNNTVAKTICSSGNTNINLTFDVTGTLFTWTSVVVSGSVTGNNNSSQPGLLINDQLINNGITDGVVKYSIMPWANNCNGPVVDYLVTVRPVPHLTNNPASKAICSQGNTNITLAFDITGTLFTWISSVISGSVTGNTNSVQPGLLINDQLINSGITNGMVKYSITPRANNCNGPVVDYLVTVYPVPHLTNNPASKTICSSSTAGISLTSDVPGTQFTWTSVVISGNVTGNNNSTQPGLLINDQLINNGLTDGMVKYSITPRANNCNGSVVDYFVTVHPAPHLTNNTTTKTICSTNNTNISLTFDVTGTLFTWTSVVTSGSVTGNNNSTQPGLLINDQLINTGNTDGVVKYFITPRANNCNGPVVDYSVTVHPHPTVNAINPQIICSGAQTQLVLLSSNVTSPVVDYSWTVSCDQGIPLCPGSGSSSTIPANAISNTTIVPQYASYTITPSVAGCQGTPMTTFHVQVNPSPTVTNTSLSQQICSGTSSNPVVLTANVSGTTFEWTAAASSSDITGYQSAPGSGNIIPQTLHNASAIQGYVNYHIIPSSQGGMACPGAPADYRIFVNPMPNPSITGEPQVCNNGRGIVYSTPAVTGHDYLWTVTGALAFTGNHSNSIAVDWGPGTDGTIQLLETDLNYPTNCSTNTPVKSIVINPAPLPAITGEANPCGQTTQVYTLGAPKANHTYSWTVSGGNSPSTNNSSVSVNWGNTNPVSLDAVESITYGPGVVCSAHAPDFPISLTLIPDAAGVISGISGICQGLSQTFSVGTIANSDSYTWWYVPSAGTTITNNGSNADLIFDLNSGSGNLYVQGQKSGCAPGPVSPPHAITVFPAPIVTLQPCNDPVTTKGAKPFLLKGGTPLNGYYSVDGTRLSSDMLDPALLSSDPSEHIISYTYTNQYSCTLSKTQLFKVNPASAFSCKSTLTDIRDQKSYPTFELVIGSTRRCWMSANLNYGAYLGGTVAQTDNCVVEKYCQGNDPLKCNDMGGFYQWDELMNFVPADNAFAQGKQGLCPPEWHVATDAEWQELVNSSLGPGIAGWQLLDPWPLYGFHGENQGVFYQNFRWAFVPPGFSATMFWSSTVSPFGNERIISHGMNEINPSVSTYYSLRNNALSVRCVRD